MKEFVERLECIEGELIAIERGFEDAGVSKARQKKLDTIISKVDILKWELIDEERSK